MTTKTVAAWLLAVVFGWAAASCGGDSGASPRDVESSDTTQANVADAERDTTDARDASLDVRDDAEAATCEFVEVDLVEGTDFVAQYVASYDHRFWWWDQADRTTVAFFRESDYASYPDDESYRFVALADIAAMSDVAADGRTCFKEFARRRALTIGRLPLEGSSRILMGNSGYHKYEGGMGDFAWDFTRVDETGTRYEGEGTANEDYLVWNEPVYAPESGYVVDVVRDAPDNAPGDYPDDATNNMVGIHLGGSYYLYLLHFRQGSIPESIQPETQVEAGELIGHVGNSGVSLEPHLHVALLWYDADADEPRSWSVPTEFEDIEVAPTPRGPFEAYDFVVPETGDSVRMAE